MMVIIIILSRGIWRINFATSKVSSGIESTGTEAAGIKNAASLNQ